MQLYCTHDLQRRNLCIYHFGGGCKQGDSCRFDHGSLEEHGLNSEEYKTFFPDHELLMKRDDRQVMPLPEDHPKDVKPTTAMSCRFKSSDDSDTDDDYKDGSWLKMCRRK